jgi:hypothetical protein
MALLEKRNNCKHAVHDEKIEKLLPVASIAEINQAEPSDSRAPERRAKGKVHLLLVAQKKALPSPNFKLSCKYYSINYYRC